MAELKSVPIYSIRGSDLNQWIASGVHHEPLASLDGALVRAQARAARANASNLLAFSRAKADSCSKERKKRLQQLQSTIDNSCPPLRRRPHDACRITRKRAHWWRFVADWLTAARVWPARAQRIHCTDRIRIASGVGSLPGSKWSERRATWNSKLFARSTPRAAALSPTSNGRAA